MCNVVGEEKESWKHPIEEKEGHDISWQHAKCCEVWISGNLELQWFRVAPYKIVIKMLISHLLASIYMQNHSFTFIHTTYYITYILQQGQQKYNNSHYYSMWESLVTAMHLWCRMATYEILQPSWKMKRVRKSTKEFLIIFLFSYVPAELQWIADKKLLKKTQWITGNIWSIEAGL